MLGAAGASLGQRVGRCRVRHFARWIGVTSIAVGVALMGGCAAWPPEGFLGHGDPATPGAGPFPSVQELLSREPAGAVVLLPHSPWGDNIQALLHEEYAAASGRDCRRLTIDPNGAAFPALACRQQSQPRTWVAVRLLQVDGYPILDSAVGKTPTWGGRQ